MASVTYSQRTERATSQPWQANDRTELPVRNWPKRWLSKDLPWQRS
jgi:hypothetical protein